MLSFGSDFLIPDVFIDGVQSTLDMMDVLETPTIEKNLTEKNLTKMGMVLDVGQWDLQNRERSAAVPTTASLTLIS